MEELAVEVADFGLLKLRMVISDDRVILQTVVGAL